MNNLKKTVIRQVALEGDYGCNLSRLFDLIKESESIKSNLDQDYKEYLWSFISGLNEISIAIANQKLECPISSKSQITSLSLSELQEKYGKNIRLIASQTHRKRAVLGVNNQSLSISPAQYSCLSMVAKYRSVGISQVDLAKVLDLDAKSCFHLIKCLIQFKLVCKIPLISKGVSTYLILHSQFAMDNPSYRSHYVKVESHDPNNKPSEGLNDLIYEAPNIQLDSENGSKIILNEASSSCSLHGELIKEKISILLQNSKNQILAAQDLILSLGIDSSKRRWLNLALSFMERAGFVEILHLKSSKSSNSLLRCIKFVKPYTLEGSKYNNQKGGKQEPRNSLVVGEGKVLVDYSLEWQIFRVIALGGTGGVLSANIRESLHLTDKACTKILERFLKLSDTTFGLTVSRVHETLGKERRYRYFASKKLLKQFMNFIAQPLLAPPPSIDLSSSMDTSPMSVSPISQEISRSTLLKKAKSTPKSIKSIKSVQKMEMDSPSSPIGLAIGKEQELKTNSVVSALQKRNIVLEILEKHKIIEMGVHIVRLYQETLDDIGIKSMFQVDRRTLHRVCETLAKDDLASLHVFQIPRLNGSHATKTLCLHSSLSPDHDLVKDYIRQMTDKCLNPTALGVKPPKKNIVEMNVQLQRLDVQSREPSPAEWFKLAKHYGYECGKMVRARLFHEWLFVWVNNKIKTDSRAVPLFMASDIFKELPLDLFVKIVGVGSQNSNLQEYLDSQSDWKIPLKELPIEIKSELGHRNGDRLRRNLLQLLEILIFLKLLTPLYSFGISNESSIGVSMGTSMQVVEDTFNETSMHVEEKEEETNKNNTRSPAYQLVVQAPFYDLSTPYNVFVRFYNLETMDQVLEYWIKLESVCTRRDSVARSKGVLKDQDPIDELQENPQQLQNLKKQVLMSRHWNQMFPFTSLQRSKIEPYINRTNGLTPYEDESKCVEISKTLGLDLRELKLYFRKIQDSYARKKNLKKQLQNAQRLSSYLSTSSANSPMNSLDSKLAKSCSSSTTTLTGTSKKKKKSLASVKEMSTPASSASTTWKVNSTDTIYKTRGLVSNSAAVQRVLDLVSKRNSNLKRSFSEICSFSTSVSESSTSTSMPMTICNTIDKSKTELMKKSGITLVAPTTPLLTSPSTIKQIDQQIQTQQTPSKIIKKSKLQAITSTSATPIIPEESLENIPDLSSFVTWDLSKKRVLWSDKESDILLYAYVMVTRIYGKAVWKPIVSLLSNRSSGSCRKRILELQKNPEYQTKYERLMAIWPTFLSEAKKLPMFDKFNHENEAHFHSMLHYFYQNAESIPIQPDKEIDSCSKAILDNPFNPLERVALDRKIEETISNLRTVRSKMIALLYLPMTMELYDNSCLCFSMDCNVCYMESDSLACSNSKENSNENDKDLHTLRCLILSILSTPEAIYDTTHALDLLSCYPEQQINHVIQSLLSRNTIARNKSSSDRKLPGRNFHLSDKFVVVLKGLFADNLIPEALSYESLLKEKLYTSEYVSFSTLINGGGMACLIHLMASKEICISPAMSMKHSVEHTRDEVERDFTMDLEISLYGCIDDAELVNSKKLKIVPATNSDVLANTETLPWKENVIQIIQESGSSGTSLKSLYKKLHKSFPNLLISDLEMFLDSHKSLYRVGIDYVLWIHEDYASHWSFSNQGYSSLVDDTTASNSTRITIPRVWTDMYGNTIPGLYKACIESVLSLIHNRPSIMESKIYSYLETVMTRVEIVEILRLLLSLGAIQRTLVYKPPCITSALELFDDVFVSQLDEQLNQVSFYSPTMDWFLKTRLF